MPATPHPSSRPLPFSSVRARPSWSMPEWGRLLPTPFAQAGRGRRAAAAGPTLAVLFSWAGPREGGIPFSRRPTIPVCAQRRVGTNPARERGRKQGAPAQYGGRQGGAHRQGPRGKRGWGMQTHSLHPPPPLYTCSCCTERGARGALTGRGRKGVVTSSHESPRITQSAEKVTWCHVTCVGVGELGQFRASPELYKSSELPWTPSRPPSTVIVL